MIIEDFPSDSLKLDCFLDYFMILVSGKFSQYTDVNETGPRTLVLFVPFQCAK